MSGLRRVLLMAALGAWVAGRSVAARSLLMVTVRGLPLRAAMIGGRRVSLVAALGAHRSVAARSVVRVRQNVLPLRAAMSRLRRVPLVAVLGVWVVGRSVLLMLAMRILVGGVLLLVVGILIRR